MSNTIRYSKLKWGQIKFTSKSLPSMKVFMKDKQKKEIDSKWQRLLERIDKPPKTRSSVIPTGAKVIRRRKGRKDLPIA